MMSNQSTKKKAGAVIMEETKTVGEMMLKMEMKKMDGEMQTEMITRMTTLKSK